MKELLSLAGNLGADVPLFITDADWALGRGRGDVIERLESNMKLWHLLLIPQASILSSEAYGWIDTAARRKAPAIEATLDAIKNNDIDLLGKNLYNDLEGLSFKKVKLLEEAKTVLMETGATGVLVSGSGPVLFGIFANEEEVIASKRSVEERLGTTGHRFKVLVAPTLMDNQ
jgi:4-diphosphocytidyl-2-C-methyl-D-erythritol kinase